MVLWKPGLLSSVKNCLIFDAMFSQILTFLILFLLINDFFKTIANSLSQSHKIDNFS